MEPLWMLYANDDDTACGSRAVARDWQNLFNLVLPLLRRPEWKFPRLWPKADAPATNLG
ncbi:MULTISPECIES: hypothetical protein [unclassified Mesorhizobium]|uniref:hypothetical protein n=1 Tax=unclassified Mesorhizobium TaxID=325217 RepID=UPI0013DF4FE2|nr:MULTISPECIES: hypothetical protein [unclassified Mesorhizobium]